jgi:hypothetical protein
VGIRRADGVRFVHVAVIEGEHDAQSDSPAFAEFHNGIGDRVIAQPVPASATLVSCYRFQTR